MLNLLACLVVLAATPQAPAQTVSTGEEFSLEKALEPEKPNLLVFYIETSAAERALAEQLSERAQKDSRVAVRLVKLKDLSAPAARAHQVTETPLVIAMDRFGRVLLRTSKLEELHSVVGKALRMARIKWIDESDPEAAETYRMMGGGKQPVPEILKTMSLQPEWMMLIARLSQMAHFSDTHLPRKTKEMIATYVSAINKCKY